MNLKSLKEILLKKAQDSSLIKSYLSSIQEDLFADMVIESLKKMAAHGQNAGRGKKPNSMLAHFANTLTSNADVAIIRDALSHHLSHYKSALQNGQREKADAHLAKIFPLMNLIHKASTNSHGRLNHTAPNSKPWEMNYTTDEKGENGRFKRLTEGWSVKAATKRFKEGKSIPNYRFMEMPPHLGHGDIRPEHEDKAYPWEDIQVGSNEDILNNRAHLYDKEVSPQESRFVPHPFDKHPINEIFTEPGKDHNDSHAEKHARDLENWHNSTEYQKAFDMALQAASKSENGFTKPQRFYEGIKPLEQPEHAKVANKKIKGIVDQPQQVEKPTYSVQDLPESLKAKFGKPKELQQQEQSSESVPQQSLRSELPESLKAKFSKPEQTVVSPKPGKTSELPESLRNLFGKKG